MYLSKFSSRYPDITTNTSARVGIFKTKERNPVKLLSMIIETNLRRISTVSFRLSHADNKATANKKHHSGDLNHNRQVLLRTLGLLPYVLACSLSPIVIENGNSVNVLFLCITFELLVFIFQNPNNICIFVFQ